jgi:hypothetical protein
MYTVISTSRISQYFSAMEHPVPQPGVADVISRIVFSANSSGITGIIPTVIDVEKPDYGINPPAGTPNQKKSIGKKPELRAFKVKKSR